jgi:hypothetical protein
LNNDVIDISVYLLSFIKKKTKVLIFFQYDIACLVYLLNLNYTLVSYIRLKILCTYNPYLKGLYFITAYRNKIKNVLNFILRNSYGFSKYAIAGLEI